MKLHRLTSLDGYCEDRLYIPQDVDALLESLPPPEERKEVCIKIEQENKNILRLEALALKKVQSCPQVVRFISNGCVDGMNYLVMEKLGPNLTELRRRSPHGTFNIYTTLKSGISCLMAIRGVHEQGLVHRDIKPSNFVTGLPGSPDRATCYLIDFGLARRYRRSNGELRPSRKNAGFRGTSRYASVASHQRLELGRVDDLWSLLFMLVEFATGTLPWRKYKDKEDIGRCKEESITPQLVRNLPREFQAFLAHLQSLVYEDEPDYDFLLSLMYRALARRGYPPNKPVDWELDPVTIEQVAEAEIRMSLHKRIDGNKLHAEKRGQNGGEGRGEIPNAEANEGNIRPPLRCPAPLQPGEVVASPSAELVGTGMGDVIRGKPASSITGKPPSLEEAMVMGNGIHISEVELRYHQNGRGEEEHNVDAAAVSSTPGALAQSLREAGGVAWQEKMPECVPAANLKDAATARRDEAGGVGKETTPLWGKESPGGSLNVDGDVDPNDFSSRECSAGSNKHPILGKKGRRKGIEKAGDSLPKSLFKEIDHQGGVSHSVLALDLPPPRKVHIDAIQQTLPDTNNTSSSRPLNDESGLKKKVKKNCDCNIM
ncbi:unnamed protein product [Phytomonas sp. EM1]|nr:unnamed protein product [Phytomonas sp. EM1]|eukprot:CCW60699.1 unnamed protein product [Phytomonas sp. isolate EM1]